MFVVVAFKFERSRLWSLGFRLSRLKDVRRLGVSSLKDCGLGANAKTGSQKGAAARSAQPNRELPCSYASPSHGRDGRSQKQPLLSRQGSSIKLRKAGNPKHHEVEEGSQHEVEEPMAPSSYPAHAIADPSHVGFSLGLRAQGFCRRVFGARGVLGVWMLGRGCG